VTRKNKATVIGPGFWQAIGLPVPVSEYKFHPVRKWRFDYAYPEKRIAIEIEGGIYTAGRHTRGVGFAGDMEKYNAATMHGWSLLRYAPNKIDFNQIRTLYNGV
jgi:very-short-patch-repair endonuclease